MAMDDVPLDDEEMTTSGTDPLAGGGDADGTDGGDSDGTDGGDSDGTDGSDSDASDGDGTDGTAL